MHACTYLAMSKVANEQMNADAKYYGRYYSLDLCVVYYSNSC